jgi:hypothetical protein
MSAVVAGRQFDLLLSATLAKNNTKAIQASSFVYPRAGRR